MIGAAARSLAGGLLLLTLAGCSTNRLLEAAATQPRVEIAGAPYFSQRDHQCGPAALATLLGAAGEPVTPETLAHEVFIPGRKGSVQAEMLAAVRGHGRVALALEPTLPAMLRELEQGRPVLVLQNFGLPALPRWHYAVVVGYDREHDAMLLSGGRGRQQRLAARRFLGTWGRADNWAFIALRPGELPANMHAVPLLDAVAALEALGQRESAAAWYQAAIKRWPSESLAWFALANNQLALSETAAAEAAYRAVLRVQPDHLPARNNLALLLAHRGCIAAATEVLAPARAAAGSGPFALVIADSWREIQALGAEAPACQAH